MRLPNPRGKNKPGVESKAIKYDGTKALTLALVSTPKKSASSMTFVQSVTRRVHVIIGNKLSSHIQSCNDKSIHKLCMYKYYMFIYNNIYIIVYLQPSKIENWPGGASKPQRQLRPELTRSEHPKCLCVCLLDSKILRFRSRLPQVLKE